MSNGSKDKIFGATCVSAAAFIFTYFSIWTFIVPFLDETSSLQKFFLPYQYAIYLPAAVLVAALSLVGAFVIKTTSKSKDKQKAK
ncbi:dolichol phosphate-mannose biosynthesis regulatory [Pilaira anomala]|nr:dolichol phosphate-mannose biosynthesis regulatory [Pilaira anomala]